MSCSRILKCIAKNTFLGAVIGAGSGQLGAKLYADAGYAGYSLSETTKAGLLGGAITGVGLGLFEARQEEAKPSSMEELIETLKKHMNIELLVRPASLVAGGVLGRLILSSISEMPIENVLLAMSSGVGVTYIAGIGVIALGLCIAYNCRRDRAEEQDNHYRAFNNV